MAEKAFKCVDCGNTYTAADGVEVYRLVDGVVCELCREDREERGGMR